MVAVKNRWRGAEFYKYYDWFKSLAYDGHCSLVVYGLGEYRIYDATPFLIQKLEEFEIEYTRRNKLFEGDQGAA